MRPLYDTKSAGDIFLSLAYDKPEKTFKDIAKENWKIWQTDNITTRQQLKKGAIVSAPVSAGHITAKFRFNEPSDPSLTENSYCLYAYPSLFFYDGRLSNRPWLQEISHPVSNTAWQSHIDMNEMQANMFGISDGDVVKLSNGPLFIEVPARLSNKVNENTIALEIGQGHMSMGRTASGIGVNSFSLLNINDFKSIPVVKVEKTGRKEDLVFINRTKEQHDRELLIEVAFDDLKKGTAGEEKLNWPEQKGYNINTDLYLPHQHKAHRWGMVIDLQACIGCKACEAACYSENNIPVTGRKDCQDGKTMSWIKVPPYNIKGNKTAFMPLPCQHCDAAPCEPVCPVFASVHTEEGLNAQIYNRCIGTRYCANNCPYKVRRFNWKNIKHEYPMSLQLNPEVSVRERGVMEKCTFCIQRIKNAEQKAKIENRQIKDGEIMTACQQTCPANAIIFGDISDERSEVRRLMEDRRRYQLLHELNTKPAVIYLKKISINL